MSKPSWMTAGGKINKDALFGIQQQMLTQDNRATSYPLFEVRDINHIYGVDTNFNDRAKRVLLIGVEPDVIEIEVDADNASARLLEAIRDMADSHGIKAEEVVVSTNDGCEMNIAALDPNYPPDDIFGIVDFSSVDGDFFASARGTGRLSITKTVATFFTEDGANAYIASNRHNLNKPFTYVSSAYGNQEMIAVMEMLALVDTLKLSPAEQIIQERGEIDDVQQDNQRPTYSLPKPRSR